MDAASSAAKSSELELVIKRTFDAPRELVWKAWTDPEYLVRWQGPKGFTTTIVTSDFRVGGGYRFHMRGPNNDDHWMQGVFREIQPPERLAMETCWADADGKPTTPLTLLTVTLEEQGGKTGLTLRHAGFETPSARDDHHGGWSSALDCLAEYLATVL